MLNAEVEWLYKSRNRSEGECEVEVVFISRDYQHIPKHNISYNIEKYNIKNHTLDSGVLITVAAHWNPPQIIEQHFYGQLRSREQLFPVVNIEPPQCNNLVARECDGKHPKVIKGI